MWATIKPSFPATPYLFCLRCEERELLTRDDVEGTELELAFAEEVDEEEAYENELEEQFFNYG